MNDYTNPFVVAAAAPAARADFYRKTYMLVAASCAVFGLVLAGTLSMPAVVNPLTQLFFGGGAHDGIVQSGMVESIGNFMEHGRFTNLPRPRDKYGAEHT